MLRPSPVLQDITRSGRLGSDRHCAEMTLRMFLEALFGKGRRERLHYWTTLSLSALAPLLIGVFLLFGMLGFLMDVFRSGRMPIALVFFWSVFSGTTAVGYLVILARRPKWFPILVAVQTVATVGLGMLTGAYVRPPQFQSPDEAFGLQFSGFGALACAMASYIFFLFFIQKEGVQHVQALTELSIAHRIQERLVPIVKLRCGAFDVYGQSRPSTQVGGDSMAVVERAGVLYAYIADVSGHGLQSGLLMSMLVSSLRTAMVGAPPLDVVLDRVNAVLPEVKEVSMYATFGGVRLSADSTAEGILAGHPPLLHYRAAHRDVIEAGDAQLPLGLFKNTSYAAFNVVIEPGDLLLLITDGLLEVTNDQGEDFGTDRIKRLLADLAGQPPEHIVVEMFKAVKAFGPQTDDQTLLLLKKSPA